MIFFPCTKRFVFLVFLLSVSCTAYAVDSDNDGLTDTEETTFYFTNPANPDTDSDLIYDGDEVTIYATDPLDNDSDDDGIIDGNEVYVSTPAFYIDDGSPEDVIFDGSRFLAVWENAWGDNKMYARFINNDGRILSGKFRPNSSDGYDQQDAHLAYDGTDYYLMWTDYQVYIPPGTSETHYRYYVRGQKFSQTGSLIGDEDVITLHIGSPPTIPKHYAASLVYDGYDYVAAYTLFATTETTYTKYFIESDSRLEVAPFMFGDDPSLHENAEIDIASNGSGHCVVFTDLAQSDADGEIAARIGSGPKLMVNTPDISWQFSPRAASNGSSYLIIWLHHAGSHLELHSRSYDGAGIPLSSPQFVINASRIVDFEPVGSNYLVIYSGNGYPNEPTTTNAVLLSPTGSLIGTPFVMPSGPVASDATTCFLLGYDTATVTGRVFSADILTMLATRPVSFADYAGLYKTDPNNADTDNDGITDGQELINGTSPLTDDYDNDGLADTDESTYGTDHTNPDTDGDLLSDGDEVMTHNTSPLLADTDNDGLSDYAEVITFGSDPNDTDTDNDGILDGTEVSDYSTDPTLADTDNDSLTDPDEIFIHSTNPTLADTDGDGLTDYAEITDHGTDPTKADTDSDGLNDSEELVHETDALVDDTDNDGLIDGDEISNNADPLDNDTDNDGLIDGDEVHTYGTLPTNSDTDSDTLSDYDEVIIHGSNPLSADTDADGLSDADEIAEGTSITIGDTDNDGLGDGDEINQYSSDPFDTDSDDDSISDGDEVHLHHTSPTNTDTDNDGLSDYPEINEYLTDPNDDDSDNDQLTDGQEVLTYHTDPLDTDTDDDGYTDSYELTNGLDPLDPDTDGDNLPDKDEDTIYATDPLNTDTDNDGIADGREFDSDNDGLTDGDEWGVHHTDRFDTDTDSDGLSDYDELFLHGTDPILMDSDNDSVSDFVELNDSRIDPLDNDTDNDGLVDGIEYYFYKPPFDIVSGGYPEVIYDATGFTLVCNTQRNEIDETTTLLLNKYNLNGDLEYDQVIDPTSFHPVTKPSIAYDGTNYCIAFQESSTYGTGQLGAFFVNDQFETIYPEIQVNSDSNVDFYSPSIIYDGSKYVVLFQSDNDSVNSDKLYRQYITPSGTLQGSNVILDDRVNRFQLPDIASDGTNYFAVWTHVIPIDESTYSTDIYGQLSENPSFLIPDSDFDASVGFNGDKYLVVFDSHAPGYGSRPTGQFYDTSGQPIGNPFLITTESGNFDVYAVGNNFLVMFYPYDSKSITAYLLTENGDKIGDVFTIKSFPADRNHWKVSVATNGERVFIAWHEIYEDVYYWGGSTYSDELYFRSYGMVVSCGLLRATAEETITTSDWGDYAGVPTKPDNPDTDNDGILDGAEVYIHNSDPLNPDTDGDLLIDGQEVNQFGTSPTSRDTDSDALNDYEEIYTYTTNPALADTDNDGLDDGEEIEEGTNPKVPDTDNEGLIDGDEKHVYQTDPLKPDTDNDSLTDYIEVAVLFTDPNDVDSDNDGLTDGNEYLVYHTQPLIADTDNDGVDDGPEVVDYETDPLDSDTDGDMLSDGDEIFTHFTDPLDIDTDDDLITDGDEINVHHTDPLDADSDKDALTDGDELLVYQSNPLSQDTDGDAVNDYDEIHTFETGILDNDTDNDGVVDGVETYIMVPEFRLNTTTTGSHELPTVGYDGKRFLVLWNDTAGYNSSNLIARYITTEGRIDGEARIINEHDPSWVWESDIATNGANVMVAWRHFDWANLGDMYGRLLDDTGAKLGSEFMINTYTTGRQKDIVVASNGNGYLAVWVCENRINSNDLFAQYFDNDGNPVGDEFMVNQYTSYNQHMPAIASDGTDYLVVWAGKTEIDDVEYPSEIIARRLSGDGTSADVFLGDEFVVNPAFNGQNYTAQSDTQDSPAVVWNESLERYYVIWMSSQTYSLGCIYGRLITSDGSFDGDLEMIVSDSVQKSSPQVANLGSNFFVAWETRQAPNDIYGRVVGYDQSLPGSVMRINTYTDDAQDTVDLISNGEELLIVWENYISGVGDSIYGVFVSNGLVEHLGTTPDPGHAYRMNPKSSDTDNDGLDDYFELYTSLTDPANADIDNDGFNDYDEYYTYGTDPYDADIDGDRLPDAQEIANGTDPYSADTDNDGLSDYDELYIYLSQPLDTDTDNDGLTDGQEQGLYVPEFRVNAYTTNAQSSPQAAFGSGAYMLVWQGDGGGDINAIMGAVYTGHGHKKTDDFMINTYSANAQNNPAVVAANNKFVVVWDGYGDPDTAGIHAQVIDNDGVAIGSQMSINTYTPNTQMHPCAASTGDAYIVVWQSSSNDGSGYDIHARLLDNDAIPAGDEFEVNQATSSDQENPSVAALNGAYFVVWHKSDGSSFDVYGRLVAADGTFLTDESIINTYTTFIQRYPRVTTAGNRYLVVWEGYGAEDTDGIYGRFVTSDGQPDGDQFLVNTYTESPDYSPAAASTGDHVLVTWHSSNKPDETGKGIYGRYLTTDGEFYGDEFHINTYTASDQDRTAVVSDGKGFMVTWTSNGQDGYATGVYATLLTREYSSLIGTQPQPWAQYRTNITVPDTDSDTYSDYDELYVYTTSPVSDDTDADGLTDYDEIEGVYGIVTSAFEYDSDNDGLSDYTEVHTYSYGPAHDERTDPLDNDSDDDLLSDFDEITVHLTDPKSADPDNDGLIDSDELIYMTDPFNADTDNDGLTDYNELFVYDSDPNTAHSDTDGISDYDEVISYDTDPKLSDTDNDGLTDFSELFVYGTPVTTRDADNDGLTDGQELAVWTDDFLVNTYTTNSQRQPMVAFNGQQYLAVWETYGQDGSNYGVVARSLSYNGGFLSDEYIANRYTTNGQYRPSVASDGDRFMIVWDGYGDTDSSSIYAMITDSDGLPSDTVFTVNATTSQTQDSAAIASNGETYMVVWESYVQDGHYDGIFARLFDNDGNPLTDEIAVNTYTTDNQQTPHIASDGDGYCITWISKFQDGSDFGIVARIFDNDGAAVTDEFMVNAYTPGLQKEPFAATDDTTYCIGWEGVGEFDSNGVFARIFDNEGNPLTGDIMLNTYTGSTQSQVSIASTGHGYFCAWQTLGGDFPTNSYEVVGRFMDITGSFSNDEVRINTFTTGSQNTPYLCSDGLSFMVMWTADILDGHSSGVAASVITSDFLHTDGMGSNLWAAHRSNPYLSDSDNDSIRDFDEFFTYFCNPNKTDTDDDLLSDADEINGVTGWQTLPNDADSDDDALIDGLETAYNAHPLDNDTDGDMIIDGDEVAFGTDPSLPDTDDDQLTDFDELYIHHTNPLDNDSDNDSITDYVELYTYATSPVRVDTDYDLLTDAQEIDQLTQPADADTDNDGLIDGWELLYQTDPYAADSDNDGLTDGDEFLRRTTGTPLNESLPNEQSHSCAAYDGSRFFVVWESSSNAGVADSYSGIFGRFADSNGSPAGGELHINAYTTSYQENPWISSDGTNFFIVWESNAQDGNDGLGQHYDEVYGALMDNEGTLLTSDVHINTHTLYYQYKPRVASNGSNYCVVWESYASGTSGQDGYGAGIFAQFYDNDGAKIGQELQLNTFTSGDQRNPSITTDGINYLVTWQTYNQTSTVSYEDVCARLFDSSGTPLTDELVVNTYTTGKQVTPSAAWSGDTFLVVWQSDAQTGADSSGSGIYGRFVYPDGTVSGDEFLINSYTTGNQELPKVNGDGAYFMVAWDSQRAAEDTPGSYGQVIKPDGTFSGGEFLIGAYGSALQHRPRVATNGTDFFITYGNDDVLSLLMTPQLPAYLESQQAGTWLLYRTAMLDPDTDGDGVSDYDEIFITHTNPLVVDAAIDSDGDGLSDDDETFHGTDPDNTDSDNDGLTDGDEVHTHHTNPLKKNSDGDDLNDYEEVIAGTSPISASSCFEVGQIGIDPQSGVISIGFSSVAGKHYRIYVQTGSSDGFVVLHDDIEATGPTTQFTDEGGGPNNVAHPSEETNRRMYKIVVKP